MHGLPDIACLLIKFIYFIRLLVILASILNLECRRDGDYNSFYLKPFNVFIKVAVVALLMAGKFVNDLPIIC